MGHRIDDETMEYVAILAKLSLTEDEKEEAKRDMGGMLDYIDMLNELNTEGVEPVTHIFPLTNVFREDTVSADKDRAKLLKNAPELKNGAFKVPKTVE